MILKKKFLAVLRYAAVALWWLALLLVMVLFCGIVGSKYRGEVPYFFGYSVMNIVSGSMEDTIPAGTYILIQKTDASEIKKGDIICFYSDDPAIKGYPNTHTVVEDPIYGENGIEFVTKGDANLLKDEETAKGDKLIGRYVTNLPLLTKFAQSLRGNGVYFFMIILGVLCTGFMIGPLFFRSQSDENEDSPNGESDDESDGCDDTPRNSQ